MYYYDEEEKIRTCPICKKMMICGPPMSSHEKAEMRMKKGYTYSNMYKHIAQTHSGGKLEKRLHDEMTDKERHNIIMEIAVEVLGGELDG